MKDKMLIGFISGMLAAVGADIVIWIFFFITHEGKNFLDWAAIISIGHLPEGLLEVIITHFILFIWDGIMGIIFVMIIPYINSKHLVYKGIIFSFALLFIFRAITVIFRVEGLENISFIIFMSHVLSSVVWGILAALSIKRFDIFPENENG